MNRRLQLSGENKVFAGVCGGIGEYFDIDPVLVRIITVILFFATGFGLLAYLVCWIAMPKNPNIATEDFKVREYSSWHKYLPGLILIAIGSLLLVREYWHWFDFGLIWPMLLIMAGAALVFMKGTDTANGTDAVQNGEPFNSHQNGESL